MVRPTLEQISNFALERVNRETLVANPDNPDVIYICKTKKYSKKFSREVTIFVCCNYYGYSKYEVARFFGIGLKAVQVMIWRVVDSEKIEKAQELFHSLEILNKSNFVKSILENFMDFSGETGKDIQNLNSFEKWLINRLYERS